MIDSNNEMNEMVQSALMGVIDLELDEFYPCEFGNHWEVIKKCLFNFLSREHMVLLDDYCDEKGLTPNDLEVLFTSYNIPLRFHELCEAYIKENIVLLGNMVEKEFYEKFYRREHGQRII